MNSLLKVNQFSIRTVSKLFARSISTTKMVQIKVSKRILKLGLHNCFRVTSKQITQLIRNFLRWYDKTTPCCMMIKVIDTYPCHFRKVTRFHQSNFLKIRQLTRSISENWQPTRKWSCLPFLEHLHRRIGYRLRCELFIWKLYFVFRGCSKTHLPSYIEKEKDLKASGIDEIVCVR